MKFANASRAIICNTVSNLDGVEVIVTGIMADDTIPFYIIERLDGKLFNTGYRAMMLIGSCLKSIQN